MVLWSYRPLRPYLSVCLSICLSVGLFLCISICLSFCLSVSLSVWLSLPCIPRLNLSVFTKGREVGCVVTHDPFQLFWIRTWQNHWPGQNVRKSPNLSIHKRDNEDFMFTPLCLTYIAFWTKEFIRSYLQKFIAIITLACFSISCKPFLTRTFKWSHIVFTGSILITVIRAGVLTLVTIYTNRRKINSFTSIIYGTLI